MTHEQEDLRNSKKLHLCITSLICLNRCVMLQEKYHMCNLPKNRYVSDIFHPVSTQGDMLCMWINLDNHSYSMYVVIL